MSNSELAMTKEEAVQKVNLMDVKKRDQQAIVKLMTGKQIKKIVHEIPGGATLHEELDQSNLPAAILTWLRRVNNFDTFEISFAGDYQLLENLKDNHQLKVKKSKVVDFHWKAGTSSFWRRKGLKELANTVADVLSNTQNVVSLIVEKEGIFVITDLNKDSSFGPEHEIWNPVLIIHN